MTAHLKYEVQCDKCSKRYNVDWEKDPSMPIYWKRVGYSVYNYARPVIRDEAVREYVLCQACFSEEENKK